MVHRRRFTERNRWRLWSKQDAELGHGPEKQSNFRAAAGWPVKQQDARFTIDDLAIGENKRNVHPKCSNTETKLNWTESYRDHFQGTTNATESPNFPSPHVAWPSFLVVHVVPIDVPKSRREVIDARNVDFYSVDTFTATLAYYTVFVNREIAVVSHEAVDVSWNFDLRYRKSESLGIDLHIQQIIRSTCKL